MSCHKSLDDAVASYKIAKEAQVKVMALEWKDRIEQNVYEAMMNWTVD